MATGDSHSMALWRNSRRSSRAAASQGRAAAGRARVPAGALVPVMTVPL
ncbi:MAG: hypothetical protein ACHP9Z_24815 [Streptosporangiales bacterium]